MAHGNRVAPGCFEPASGDRCRPVPRESSRAAAKRGARLAAHGAQRSTRDRARPSAVLQTEPGLSNNVVRGGPRRARPASTRAGRGRRLRVAVDVDEVLGRFLHSLNKFCFEEFGSQYDVCDYAVYNFAEVWGCHRDEANRRVHQFFQSHHFAVGILPIPGALHSLQRLKASCDLVVVTSRQHVIQQPTLRWIQTHFPDVFQEVHFGNHWALSGESRKKSDICRDIGAAVLIDDNPHYALDCAEAGLQVLLYDWQLTYPWAKTADGLCRPSHPLIRRVRDWNEVEVELRDLAGSGLELGACRPEA